MNNDDKKVLVTGCDMDGIARGKIINASKFTDLESSTFGFCSVVFGWDMHDSGYNPKTPSMLVNEGFSDLLAKIDMNSFRRCPLTKQAHYLVDFLNPVTREPLSYCPRSLLKSVISKNPGLHAYTGVEFEFYNFKETVESLSLKKGSSLTPLTPGMFGYSVLRPAVYQEYFDEIYDAALRFGIPIECFHTETGPGVYEAALEYCNTLELADRAHLFKLMTKKVGIKRKHFSNIDGITPTFMAKPYSDQPGCSGHLHFSLQDSTGKNLFVNNSDPELISDTLRHFVAGILKGLPSIMAILAPTINSYKRLNVAYWAPVTVSYGFESRLSAIRIITPPTCSRAATRIEIRVPGADINCYLACAAILACGYYGIKEKLPLPALVPLSDCDYLPMTLRDAIKVMESTDSLAREVLGSEFVDHYVATRKNELRRWDLAVTDWELMRYLETV